ncbi:MAG: hypothetical protein Q9179_005869, partial [Wetmoreana sp. 5 TL-2023]
LSAGVDVYSDWIDACDSVAKEAAHTAGDEEASNHYQDHTPTTGSGRRRGLESGQAMSAIDDLQDDDMGAYGDNET